MNRWNTLIVAVTTLVVIAGTPLAAAGADAEPSTDAPLLGSGLDPSPRSSLSSSAVNDTSPTVSIGSVTTTVDSSATVDVVLSGAPDGLAGYRINVTVGNGSVASIDAASIPSKFDINTTTVGAANETVELEAVDLGENVQPGASDVRLASIEIRVTNPGETTLAVDVEKMDNDTGSAFAPGVQNGTISVPACQALAAHLPMPTDPDGDGDYEDTNGNGRLDYDDMVTFFQNMDNAPTRCHDFNNNGRIGFDDIVTLFEEH